MQRPTGSGGVRAIVTHLGPMADGGGGSACDRNTPRTYSRWGGGGVRAIVTHHRPMTGWRTYDRRGCLKKEDKYASDLMLRRTLDRALKNRTIRLKAGRMATLRQAHHFLHKYRYVYVVTSSSRTPWQCAADPQGSGDPTLRTTGLYYPNYARLHEVKFK